MKIIILPSFGEAEPQNMLADEGGYSKDDNLLCHKHASARGVKVLSVECITFRRGRRCVVDHGIRDPGMLSGGRVRLYEGDRTTQHVRLWCVRRSHDAIGVALTSGRDAAVLAFVASKLRGVRRGV